MAVAARNQTGWWGGLLLVLLLAACAQMPPAAPEPTVISTRILTATVTPQVIATFYASETWGELTIEDGCVGLDGQVLTWPPEFRVTVEPDSIHVLGGFATGNHTDEVYQVGEWLYMGGGEDYVLDEQLQSTVPTHCPGPYWVVAPPIQRTPPVFQPTP